MGRNELEALPVHDSLITYAVAQKSELVTEFVRCRVDACQWVDPVAQDFYEGEAADTPSWHIAIPAGIGATAIWTYTVTDLWLHVGVDVAVHARLVCILEISNPEIVQLSRRTSTGTNLRLDRRVCRGVYIYGEYDITVVVIGRRATSAVPHWLDVRSRKRILSDEVARLHLRVHGGRSDPVITSICIPAEQMAQAATDYLLGCLDGAAKQKRLNTTLSVDLVDRGTTRRL